MHGSNGPCPISEPTALPTVSPAPTVSALPTALPTTAVPTTTESPSSFPTTPVPTSEKKSDYHNEKGDDGLSFKTDDEPHRDDTPACSCDIGCQLVVVCSIGIAMLAIGFRCMCSNRGSKQSNLLTSRGIFPRRPKTPEYITASCARGHRVEPSQEIHAEVEEPIKKNSQREKKVKKGPVVVDAECVEEPVIVAVPAVKSSRSRSRAGSTRGNASHSVETPRAAPLSIDVAVQPIHVQSPAQLTSQNR